ncbi:MAG: hypothetical protein CW346_11105 [Bacillaceae bacterium]|nr:hypothetical protein [Bacillaceae bacterium]
MHSIKNIVFINDIAKLPKEMLKEICTDLNLDDSGIKPDLAMRIWEYLRQNQTSQDEALEKCKNKLLAGQTSITWYQFDRGDLENVEELIIKNCGFNPFEEIQTPYPEELTTEPVLICAAKGETDEEIYLRFMYKSGVRRDYYVTGVNVSPKSEIVTVYLNTQSGILEVRADPRKSEKIAKSVAQILNRQVIMEQVTAPFGEKIESIADKLKGELIDATSKPELLLEDFTERQAKAVVEILQALDKFLKSNDIDELEENLKQANEAFDDEMLSVPFAALILCGMEKVGFGGERELRGLPLYDSLNPYLQHQGGFIRFKYPEDSLEKSYTIRVGMTSKSIYFTTPATEQVIDYVRKNVIL